MDKRQTPLTTEFKTICTAFSLPFWNLSPLYTAKLFSILTIPNFKSWYILQYQFSFLFISCSWIIKLYYFRKNLVWKLRNGISLKVGKWIGIKKVFLFLEGNSGPFFQFTCYLEQSREVEKVRWHYNSVEIDSRNPHL